MKVTQVNVFKVEKTTNGKLRAFARVILDDELQLTSLRVYEGSQGLFVSYPNDPLSRSEDYRQLFYPVTKALRDNIEECILAEYAKE